MLRRPDNADKSVMELFSRESEVSCVSAARAEMSDREQLLRLKFVRLSREASAVRSSLVSDVPDITRVSSSKATSCPAIVTVSSLPCWFASSRYCSSSEPASLPEPFSFIQLSRADMALW